MMQRNTLFSAKLQMNYPDIPTNLRAKTASLFSWVFMLPWHEVLQKAHKGRLKCVGLNKFPWNPPFILLFRLTLKKGVVNWGMSHLLLNKPPHGSNSRANLSWSPVLFGAAQLLLLFCTDSLPPCPKRHNHPSTSDSTWPGTWEEQNMQRFESLLTLRVRRVWGISALILHHHTTYYTSILNAPLEREKQTKQTKNFPRLLTSCNSAHRKLSLNVTCIDSKCR